MKVYFSSFEICKNSAKESDRLCIQTTKINLFFKLFLTEWFIPLLWFLEIAPAIKTKYELLKAYLYYNYWHRLFR